MGSTFSKAKTNAAQGTRVKLEPPGTPGTPAPGGAVAPGGTQGTPGLGPPGTAGPQVGPLRPNGTVAIGGSRKKRMKRVKRNKTNKYKKYKK